jgi:hypothetical protein
LEDRYASTKELEDSGLSLREYLDKHLRKGKPRKEPAFAGKGKTAEEIMAEDKPRGMKKGGSVRGSGCATKGTRALKW